MILESLGIVTSVTGGYGAYLAEWADSILEQRVRPAGVGIFTHGTDADRTAAIAARARLEGAGFHVKHRHEPERWDFGRARNAAVGLLEHEWCMHLDADDRLMPHALADVRALMAGADVVAIGYERLGVTPDGPRCRRKVYRSSVGTEALESRAPASGISPFRRAFWERAPYRTDLLGGWDTALWLGFAHLGARFAATTRPGFYYRQHTDSIFLSRLRSPWLSERVGARLQSLRRGDRGVAVIVPIAGHDAHRSANWQWLEARYRALFPAWQICTGGADPRRWDKRRAIDAAIRGCTADILVIADADCVLAPEALLEAVRLLESGEASWVVPHTLVHRLTERATASWRHDLDRPVVVDGDLARVPYRGFAGGGVLVVRRSDYVASGGIPPGFVGWGGEDEALAIVLDTLLGPHTRLPFDLVHLWHPPQAGGPGTSRSDDTRRNRALWRAYARLAGDVERLWAMVSGERGPHLGSYTEPIIRHRTTGARGSAFRNEVAPMIRDSFAERRLARQAITQREVLTMPSAFDLRKQQRAETIKTRREQAERNEDANRAREKAKLERLPNKSRTPSENKGEPARTFTTTEPRFATTRGEEVALELGLDRETLDRLMAEAGENGITVKQLRAAVGSEHDESDGE